LLKQTLIAPTKIVGIFLIKQINITDINGHNMCVRSTNKLGENRQTHDQ